MRLSPSPETSHYNSLIFGEHLRWLTHYGWIYFKEIKAETANSAVQPEEAQTAQTKVSYPKRLGFLWCGLVWLVLFPCIAKGMSPVAAFFVGLGVAFITMPLGIILLAAPGKFFLDLFTGRNRDES